MKVKSLSFLAGRITQIAWNKKQLLRQTDARPGLNQTLKVFQMNSSNVLLWCFLLRTPSWSSWPPVRLLLLLYVWAGFNLLQIWVAPRQQSGGSHAGFSTPNISAFIFACLCGRLCGNVMLCVCKLWPPSSDWLILSSPRSHGRPAGSHLIPDVHVLVLLRSVGSRPLTLSHITSSLFSCFCLRA